MVRLTCARRGLAIMAVVLVHASVGAQAQQPSQTAAPRQPQRQPAAAPAGPTTRQQPAGAKPAAANAAAARQPGRDVRAPDTKVEERTTQAPVAKPPAAQAASGTPATSKSGPGPAAAPRSATAGAAAARQPAARVAHQEMLPFRALTPAEEARLDQVLAAWEVASDKVKTLSATFTLWEYDTTFNPAGANPSDAPRHKRKSTGDIKFAAPDRGAYHVAGESQEKWICDGQAIYEFNFQQKKLKEYRLPPELQGKAITNGPLPFVFGAKAITMKQRYFLRLMAEGEGDAGRIWIEAWPKLQQDAANFHHVQVILDAKTMLPSAMKLFEPNGNDHKVYAFADVTTNGPWNALQSFFLRPTTPIGWKHVVEEAPAPPEAAPGPRQQPDVRAARPATTKTR